MNVDGRLSRKRKCLHVDKEASDTTHNITDDFLLTNDLDRISDETSRCWSSGGCCNTQRKKTRKSSPKEGHDDAGPGLFEEQDSAEKPMVEVLLPGPICFSPVEVHSEDVTRCSEDLEELERTVCTSDEKLCHCCKLIVPAKEYADHILRCIKAKFDIRQDSSKCMDGEDASCVNGLPVDLVPPCPICLKPLGSRSTRQAHIKACGSSQGLTPQQLVHASRLFDIHTAEREDMGLPAFSSVAAKISEKQKGTCNKRNKHRQVSDNKSKGDTGDDDDFRTNEDGEIAILETRSTTKEKSKHFGFLKSDSAKAHGHPSKTSRSRGSKGLQQFAMTRRSPEDRDRIISEKVAHLLIAESSPKHFDNTTLFVPSCHLAAFHHVASSLWNANASASERPLSYFYVSELEPHIQPKDIPVGQLLRHLSQIPGRLNVTRNMAEDSESDSECDIEFLNADSTQSVMTDLLSNPSYFDITASTVEKFSYHSPNPKGHDGYSSDTTEGNLLNEDRMPDDCTSVGRVVDACDKSSAFVATTTTIAATATGGVPFEMATKEESEQQPSQKGLSLSDIVSQRKEQEGTSMNLGTTEAKSDDDDIEVIYTSLKSSNASLSAVFEDESKVEPPSTQIDNTIISSKDETSGGQYYEDIRPNVANCCGDSSSVMKFSSIVDCPINEVLQDDISSQTGQNCSKIEAHNLSLPEFSCPPDDKVGSANKLLSSVCILSPKSVQTDAINVDGKISSESQLRKDKIVSEVFYRNFCSDWEILLASGKLSDVDILTSGEHIIHAHSLVLFCRCPALYLEIKDCTVNWKSISYNGALIFIQYIYLGRCNLTADDRALWMDVYDLAVKYACSDLLKHLESEYKSESLSPSKLQTSICLGNLPGTSVPHYSLCDKSSLSEEGQGDLQDIISSKNLLSESPLQNIKSLSGNKGTIENSLLSDEKLVEQISDNSCCTVSSDCSGGQGDLQDVMSSSENLLSEEPLENVKSLSGSKNAIENNHLTDEKLIGKSSDDFSCNVASGPNSPDFFNADECPSAPQELILSPEHSMCQIESICECQAEIGSMSPHQVKASSASVGFSAEDPDNADHMGQISVANKVFSSIVSDCNIIDITASSSGNSSDYDLPAKEISGVVEPGSSNPEGNSGPEVVDACDVGSDRSLNVEPGSSNPEGNSGPEVVDACDVGRDRSLNVSHEVQSNEHESKCDSSLICNVWDDFDDGGYTQIEHPFHFQEEEECLLSSHKTKNPSKTPEFDILPINDISPTGNIINDDNNGETLLNDHSGVVTKSPDATCSPFLKVSRASTPPFNSTMNIAAQELNELGIGLLESVFSTGIEVTASSAVMKAVSNVERRSPGGVIPTAPSQMPRKKGYETPVTPMPDYHNMVSPALKMALDKYGIRKMSRKNAVMLLTYIYEQLHPLVTETEGDNSTEDSTTQCKIKSNIVTKKHSRKQLFNKSLEKVSVGRRKALLKGERRKKEKDEEEGSVERRRKKMDKSSIPNSEEEEEHDSFDSPTRTRYSEIEYVETSLIPQESNVSPTELTPTQTVSLSTQISNFIRNSPELHRKVLMYEPFWLHELHADLKANEIKCSVASLMNYLDEQCITFRVKQAPRRKAKSGGRKKEEEPEVRRRNMR